jgi:phage FluMu protein Com
MPSIRCAKCSRWLTPEESGQPCPRCGSLERNVFEQDEAVAHDKATVAIELAKKHYQAEAGLQKVIRLMGSAEVEVRPVEPIKLLEVNANTIPSGVLPVSFGPAPASGISYSSVIVEVSPEEFAKIQTQELKLPKGWLLGEELAKPPEDPEGE